MHSQCQTMNMLGFSTVSSFKNTHFYTRCLCMITVVKVAVDEPQSKDMLQTRPDSAAPKSPRHKTLNPSICLSHCARSWKFIWQCATWSTCHGKGCLLEVETKLKKHNKKIAFDPVNNKKTWKNKDCNHLKMYSVSPIKLMIFPQAMNVSF